MNVARSMSLVSSTTSIPLMREISTVAPWANHSQRILSLRIGTRVPCHITYAPIPSFPPVICGGQWLPAWCGIGNCREGLAVESPFRTGNWRLVGRRSMVNALTLSGLHSPCHVGYDIPFLAPIE